jgi:cyclopropane-fatty-acyl-phospholipid synthase
MSATATKASSTILSWTERGLVPDSVIRSGIRQLCRQRLKDIAADDLEKSARNLNEFVRHMNQAPVALVPEMANEQHYEVPPAFFERVMGRHAKYSCRPGLRLGLAEPVDRPQLPQLHGDLGL